MSGDNFKPLCFRAYSYGVDEPILFNIGGKLKNLVSTDEEAFAVMTSENLAREDVNPVDEAIHTKRLMEMNDNDFSRVSDILNRSRDWVQSRLEVADMSPDLQAALRGEKIKLGVALALNQISDETDRSAVLQMAISQGASVVVAQYWLAQWKAGLFGHATTTALPDPNAPEHERKVITLRCALEGKDYPAEDMRTVLVFKENLGYIDAMREHLFSEKAHPALDTHADLVSAGGEGR